MTGEVGIFETGKLELKFGDGLLVVFVFGGRRCGGVGFAGVRLDGEHERFGHFL